MRDGPVDAPETLRRAWIERVRNGNEGAALRVRRREGDAEVPRREARDVEVRAPIGTGGIREDAREPAPPFEVGDRRVRGLGDALDVVRDVVSVVVVQRRCVDAEHHVVDDGAL